ncbi:MAG: hypothetical protein WD061_03395 [Candidatus Saccharimonadales bacterium]
MRKILVENQPIHTFIALMRIGIGAIFTWAFVDKLWGLGFATCRSDGVVDVMCGQAWANGGSPTTGFLQFGTSGPFESFYTSLAGNPFIDWAFMLGLLLVGVALILGMGIKLAVTGGSLLLLMMWSAVLPPEHNPVISEHLIYILGLLIILVSNRHQVLGLGRWWESRPIVRRYGLLK